MSTVVRFGQSSVTETDRGADAAKARLKILADTILVIGIPTEAKNAYGERIATYAFVNASERFPHAGWISRAFKAVQTEAGFDKAALHREAVSGTAPLASGIDRAGSRLAGIMRASAAAEGIRESGALIEAIDFISPTHPRRTNWPVTKTRISRAGGYADLTLRQQLYQTYHAGRSKSMREMRHAVSWKQFQDRHILSFSKSTQAERTRVKTTVRRQAAAAQKVLRENWSPKSRAQFRRSFGGRAYNTSRAKMLNALLTGGA
jgi:hypothetical protein